MPDLSDPTMGPDRCFRCHAEPPPDAPLGLCPTCLFAAAADPMEALAEEELRPGELFGPYRIERLLGRGGMGEVYVAEQLEQGRRVALKVLAEQLASEADRTRFLQEGQLAASLNHSHSVYIFGSEEIDGRPVIAMELLPGGTLKDRVQQQGPLPPAEAVDAILQVVAGLEAAEGVGILHRDVKPSNCFIDRDGTVKVGDFGLSISTLAREARSCGTPDVFHGTPLFASPEQLRGAPLDVRADIYAVGATLYYLLTGQAPFDGCDLRALAATTASQAPPSARALESAIPAELDALVLRCLARDPACRPATYAQLADRLKPFSSEVAMPGPLGLRLAASAFDGVLLIGAAALIDLLARAWFTWDVPTAVPSTILVVSLFYWSVSEGVWGASYGKASCALRVVTTAGGRPGIARALVRSSILLMPVALAAILSPLWDAPSRRAHWPGLGSMSALAGVVVLLMSTGTPRNGWAGLHEIVSGTRVVRRRLVNHRPTLESAARGPAPCPTWRVGPYDVVAPIGTTDRGEILLARDSRLKRAVWVHALRAPTAAVSALLRGVSRPGRLHWLSGQRTSRDSWDAYDASEGAPLVTTVAPQPWRTVRQWLLDLAQEIDAGLQDGSVEALALDHVWITRDGRAKLLDFRAPGVPASTFGSVRLSTGSAERFLSDVAHRMLQGPAIAPLPLSAAACLQRLERQEFATLADVVKALTGLLTQPAFVTRRQREMALALGAVATMAGAVALGGIGELACALLGVLWAVVLRGGFWLRALGIAVVTGDGAEASRWRAASRATLTWLWVPAQLMASVHGGAVLRLTIWAVTVIVFSWAGDHPERGLQDRMAGTYLVPR
jgi:hypothetical protein